MADDTADEVKVFRRQDADDLESTAQSSHQLAEDKKEVALETELEARPIGTHENLLGGKGAFKAAAPSPSFLNMGMGMPPFSPSYYSMFSMPWLATMGMGQAQAAAAAAYGHAARMSPSFMGMGMGFMPPAAMSPSFNAVNAMYGQLQMLASPGSPLHAHMAAKNAQIPLPPSMRTGNPLNQMNNMRLPYNQMSSMANSLAQATTPKRSTEDRRIKPHIKKPLNAFMWFMKENRPKLMAETGHKEKQSADLNKELGRRWHSLTKEEQQRYFELAKKDREDHKLKYPQWSARENYAIHKKKKRKREKSEDESGELKKCRARFGINQQQLWCKFCKRKKKCEYSIDRSSSSTEPSISGDHPLLNMDMENDKIKMELSDMDDVNVSDSESDMNDCEDDTTLTQQTLDEIAFQQDSLIT